MKLVCLLFLILLSFNFNSFALADEGGSLRASFYAESYKNPVSQGSSHFQRFDLGWVDSDLQEKLRGLSPYLSVENYQATSTENNIRPVVGLRGKFREKIEYLVAFGKNHLNYPERSRYDFRAGTSAGNFWNLSTPRTFAEAYGEAFVLLPEKEDCILTVAGWFKLGYRAYDADHWILDPALLEIRYFDNSDQEAFGSRYQMLNLGPRITRWWSAPEFSTSLFVAVSQSWSSSDRRESDHFWILWTLGAGF